MRWNEPKEGDTKPWKRKFAFLPVFIKVNEEWIGIWWERYEQRKVYKLAWIATKGGPMIRYKWVTELRLINESN